MSVAVHHRWAPHGARRFVEMVDAGYFNGGDGGGDGGGGDGGGDSGDGAVPFMRCVAGFLCQFGLHADAARGKAFERTIPDDPNWLLVLGRFRCCQCDGGYSSGRRPKVKVSPADALDPLKVPLDCTKVESLKTYYRDGDQMR
jgi:hypothetical protein